MSLMYKLDSKIASLTNLGALGFSAAAAGGWSALSIQNTVRQTRFLCVLIAEKVWYLFGKSLV